MHFAGQETTYAWASEDFAHLGSSINQLTQYLSCKTSGSLSTYGDQHCYKSREEVDQQHLHADDGVDGFEGGVHGACAHAGSCPDHVVWPSQLDCGCGQAHRATHHLQQKSQPGNIADLIWSRRLSGPCTQIFGSSQASWHAAFATCMFTRYKPCW